MKLRSLWWAGVLAGLVVAVGAALPGARSDAMAADKWEPSDFENASPAVESLDLTSLPAGASEDGNALLEIRYTLGQELPATIELTIDERKVVLRNNENDPMLYTAIIDFDFDALIEEQEQRQQLAQTIRSVPVFDGRELAGNIGLAFLEPNELRARVLGHEPVRIPWETIFDIPGEVRPEKSLLITDTSVVQDPTRTFDYCDKRGGPNGTGNPDGAWTFKTLMTHMSNQPLNSKAAARFVSDWMVTYGSRPSAAERFIQEWPTKQIEGEQVIDLDRAPMRLLAIVNRQDIRNNIAYGGSNAGEVRFVFGALGMDGNSGGGTLEKTPCRQLAFTVILEYGIPKRGCNALRDYARQWKALGHLSWGPTYNHALENATRVVTARNAAPLKPNGSAINQLRSNEISLIQPTDAPPSLDQIAENRLPWELREYHLDPGTQQLRQARVALTPERTRSPNLNVNGTARLARFINANATRIVNNRYEVPQTYENLPFQATKSHNPHTLPGGVWNAVAGPGIPAITNQLARHRFSLNTCNACHGSETQTSFLHIIPRDVGEEAGLSSFMVGDSGSLQNPGLHAVEDPISHVVRQFGELHHRQQDLETLASRSCAATGIFPDLLGNRVVIRSH